MLLQRAQYNGDLKGRTGILDLFTPIIKMETEHTYPIMDENIVQDFVHYVTKPTLTNDPVADIARAYYTGQPLNDVWISLSNTQLRRLIDNSPSSSAIFFTMRYAFSGFKTKLLLSDTLTESIKGDFLARATILYSFLQTAKQAVSDIGSKFIFDFYGITKSGASPFHPYGVEAPTWTVNPDNSGELMDAILSALTALQFESGRMMLAIRFEDHMGKHYYLLVMTYDRMYGFGDDVKVLQDSGAEWKFGGSDPQFLLSPKDPDLIKIFSPEQRAILKDIIREYYSVPNSYNPYFKDCIKDLTTGAQITYKDYVNQIIQKFNYLATNPDNPLPIYNLYSHDGKIYWWNIFDARCNYDKTGKIEWRENT